MRVTKHDGAKLFGIGFRPDILVKRTIKGITDRRDELLDTALEIARDIY
jgi:hypothetical protein